MTEIPTDPVKRAQEFEAAFNRIDAHLRHETGMRDKGRSVGSVIHQYQRAKPAMAQRLDMLRDYADLRNALVHERTNASEYIAYPSEETLLGILKLEQQLTAPARVEQEFIDGPVQTVSPETTIAELLDLIQQRQFTRFPVYNARNTFLGLITSNAFAKWVASRPGSNADVLRWSDHTVSELLEFDQNRKAVMFVPRTELVLEVRQLFWEHSELQAIIITRSGEQNQKPLGIITPWDIARYEWDGA